MRKTIEIQKAIYVHLLEVAPSLKRAKEKCKRRIARMSLRNVDHMCEECTKWTVIYCLSKIALTWMFTAKCHDKLLFRTSQVITSMVTEAGAAPTKMPENKQYWKQRFQLSLPQATYTCDRLLITAAENDAHATPPPSSRPYVIHSVMSQENPRIRHHHYPNCWVRHASLQSFSYYAMHAQMHFIRNFQTVFARNKTWKSEIIKKYLSFPKLQKTRETILMLAVYRCCRLFLRT